VELPIGGGVVVTLVRTTGPWCIVKYVPSEKGFPYAKPASGGTAETLSGLTLASTIVRWWLLLGAERPTAAMPAPSPSADDAAADTAATFDGVSVLPYNEDGEQAPADKAGRSEDPIGFEAGDANLYRYVGNSATNFTDPSGTESWSVSTARSKLRELQLLWMEAGFSFAPELLGDFLAHRPGGNKSQYADLVKNTVAYNDALRSYVIGLVRERNYQPGTYTIAPGGQAVFTVAFLSRIGLVNTLLFGYTAEKDVAYAVGDGRFFYTQATLTIKTRERRFPTGKTTVPGIEFTATFTTNDMTLKDQYTHADDGGWEAYFRRFFSEYYDAGAYLESDVQRLSPVNWSMTFSESTTYTYKVTVHTPGISVGAGLAA
jgi:hypothetical protein